MHGRKFEGVSQDDEGGDCQRIGRRHECWAEEIWFGRQLRRFLEMHYKQLQIRGRFGMVQRWRSCSWSRLPQYEFLAANLIYAFFSNLHISFTDLSMSIGSSNRKYSLSISWYSSWGSHKQPGKYVCRAKAKKDGSIAEKVYHLQ